MAVYLVTGGARSGKSRYAESLALRLCADGSRRAYVATAEAFDDEMKDRIRLHRESRGDDFFTIEEPVRLSEALLKAQETAQVILVDCLTVWAGNLLYYKAEEERGRLMDTLASIRCDVVIVTNETGMGIVPDNALSREFRDLSGSINQEVASIADSVVLMVCGIPLPVKGTL